MTKRFYIAESNLVDGYCVFDRERKYSFSPRPRKADCLNDTHILNELVEENEQLRKENYILKQLLEEDITQRVEIKEVCKERWG